MPFNASAGLYELLQSQETLGSALYRPYAAARVQVLSCAEGQSRGDRCGVTAAGLGMPAERNLDPLLPSALSTQRYHAVRGSVLRR